jgi:hypothetical protein
MASADYISGDISVFFGQSSNADFIPPAAINNLTYSESDSVSVALSWLAPGDDGWEGKATRYDIRYSANNLTESNWNEAMPVVNSIVPLDANEVQSAIFDNLPIDQDIFLAIRSLDEANNYSDISNALHIHLLGTFTSFLCGDVNWDGHRNLKDISYIINALYRGGPAIDPREAADVNGDGKINLLDISYFINNLYKSGPGFNCP